MHSLHSDVGILCNKSPHSIAAAKVQSRITNIPNMFINMAISDY